MPLIPIAIYIINIFFPAGGAGKRRRRQAMVGPFEEGDAEEDGEVDLRQAKEWLRSRLDEALKTLHAALEQYRSSADQHHLDNEDGEA